MITSSIEKAEIYTIPIRHIIIDNFLSDELLTLCEFEFPKRHEEKYVILAEHSNVSCTIKLEKLNSCLFSSLKKKFKIEGEKSHLYFQGNWNTGCDDFSPRKIHYDYLDKTLSGMIYLNDKKWTGGDLSFHEFKDKSFDITQDLDLNDTRFELIKTIECKKNRAIFWENNNNALHSVTPISNLKGYRKAFNFSIRVL